MNFNRRNFIKGLGILGLGSTQTALVAETIQLPQDNTFDFLCPPYLQHKTEGQTSIFSIFNKPCIAWVELLDEHNQILQTVYQVEDGMRNANATLFQFIINHDHANFKYRIVAKEILKFEAYKIEYGKTIHSKDYETALATQNQESISCLILNDIHENAQSYPLLYHQSKIPQKDLVFLNGDSFHYVNNRKDLVDKLLIPVGETFASQTAFIMVRGNHETRGSFARDFKKYFDFKEQKFYQAFKKGPIFWIMLDSGEDKPDSHEVYAGTIDYDHYRLEQKTWLEKILKSKERKAAKHTIVVTHIPFHHSDDWHGTIHNKECFHEVLQNNKVDAVISGHTHKHGFYPPDQEHNYYVIIGAGPKVGERTYIEVSANGKQLNVSLNKEDGTLIQSFSKS